MKKDLCLSCRLGGNLEDFNGKTLKYCHEFCKPILVQISKCSSYQDKGTPAKHEMEKIAWVLMSDKKGPLGFTPVKDLTREEKEKLGLGLEL